MNRRDYDAFMFDASDVEHEIKTSKRRDRVEIHLRSDTDFNVVKVYLALKEICAKIEGELNIMELSEGEH